MTISSEYRKKFMKDTYSKYWISAREKKYGFLEYDKNLCKLILSRIKKESTILDVGVGTGYPFGRFFIRQNFSVHGIDVSNTLIERCKITNPKIKAKVSDAEKLDYNDDSFDAVYSFHSSWYFPDIIKAINEMLRVCKKEGHIFFDIQNTNNSDIKKEYERNAYENRGIGKLVKFSKNCVRLLLGRKGINWHFVIISTPIDPNAIFSLEKKDNLHKITACYRDKQDNIRPIMYNASLKPYSRLVFILTKR